MRIGFGDNREACYIYCEDQAFLKIILYLFEEFDITDSDENHRKNENSIKITSIEEGKYFISHDKFKKIWPIEQTLGYTVRTILEILGKESNNKFFIHGGCVQYNGKCNCFLGRTKAGKSTLAYSLCKTSNCKYVTDDLICIKESLRCIPFMKPIFLRDSKYIDDGDDVMVIQYQDEYRYCILPQFRVSKYEEFNIDNIFIIEREPSENFKVEKLSVSAAFINIWKNMYASAYINEKRALALKLAKNTNVYKVKYREVSEDLMLLLEYMK